MSGQVTQVCTAFRFARLLALLGCLVLIVSGCGPDGTKGGTFGRVAGGRDDRPPVIDVWPPRAVWVPRQAYRSPQQIADLMQRIRDAGLNTVLFQVRRNGTAFYRSSIEPLAEEYTRGDPGFDPLTVACREAHRRGLAIHA